MGEGAGYRLAFVVIVAHEEALRCTDKSGGYLLHRQRLEIYELSELEGVKEHDAGWFVIAISVYDCEILPYNVLLIDVDDSA